MPDGYVRVEFKNLSRRAVRVNRTSDANGFPILNVDYDPLDIGAHAELCTGGDAELHPASVEPDAIPDTVLSVVLNDEGFTGVDMLRHRADPEAWPYRGSLPCSREPHNDEARDA